MKTQLKLIPMAILIVFGWLFALLAPAARRGGNNGGAKVGKIRITAMAILFAIGQALPASANHPVWSDNKGTNLLIDLAIGCGSGLLIASFDDEIGLSKGANCALGAAVFAGVSVLSDALFHAAPHSRWSFDGNDGMPKAVYSLSDAAKLSFGAKGEVLDYDGATIGVQYSF